MDKVILTPGAVERVTDILIYMYEKHRELLKENEELINKRLEVINERSK